MGTNDLTEVEAAAWDGLVRAQLAISHRLAEELRPVGLGLNEYRVLAGLYDADQRALRMTDVARQVEMSPGGFSRLVDRLEQAGHVERRRCREDARGFWATLTPAGVAVYEAARAIQAACVREHLLTHISEDEQRCLADVWERVVSSACSGQEPLSSTGFAPRTA